MNGERGGRWEDRPKRDAKRQKFRPCSPRREMRLRHCARGKPHGMKRDADTSLSSGKINLTVTKGSMD